MGKIHILDMEISNKIAAGEVVERPVSVIKELVENSIDAGAEMITVEIKNGGRTYIRVTDNGKGMAPEDAQIAFLRHATSKIQTTDDLDAIYTLGFRGEALSSIGAVARVELYTKQRGDEMGTRVTCDGGEIIASDDAGAADGTTLIVKDLFYNTPARMKFMKKDSTEGGHIQDVISRFVLAYPEISIRLISNGRQQIFSPGDNSRINAVYTVYGRDYASNMLETEYEYEGIRVRGVIGNSNLARPNRNFQSFFINRRYIKSPMLIRALEEAYKNQVMIGKHPVAALNIEINPADIDINVHPTKLEVKFSQEKPVYEAVYHAVKNRLYAMPNIPKLEKVQKPEGRGLFELCAELSEKNRNEENTISYAARGHIPKPAYEERSKERNYPIERITKPAKSGAGEPSENEDILTYLSKMHDGGDEPQSGILKEPASGTITDMIADAARAQEETAENGGGEENKNERPWEETERIKAGGREEQNLYIPDVRIAGQVFNTYIIAQ